MSIPEPEFKINAYQLESILKELGYDVVENIRELRCKCFEHLDTL